MTPARSKRRFLSWHIVVLCRNHRLLRGLLMPGTSLREKATPWPFLLAHLVPRPALRLDFDSGLCPPLRMTPRANARVSPDQACHSERAKHHSAVFCESNPTIGGRASRGISPGIPPKPLCKETEDAAAISESRATVSLPQRGKGDRLRGG